VLKGFNLRSPGNFLLKGERLDLVAAQLDLKSAGAVDLTGVKTSFVTSELNGDIAMNTKGGSLISGNMKIDSSTIESMDRTKGLLLTSKSKIMLGDERVETTMHAQKISMQAKESIVISAAASLTLETGYDSPIIVKSTSGLQVDDLNFSGRTVKNMAPKMPLILDSASGIIMRPAEDEAVEIHSRFTVDTAKSISLSGAEMSMASTKWNQNIDIGVKGGSMSVDKMMHLDGAQIENKDTVKGLRMRSTAGNILLKPQSGQGEIQLVGGQMRFEATDALSLSAKSLNLNTALNGDITLLKSGGAVNIDRLKLEGTSVNGGVDGVTMNVRSDGQLRLDGATMTNVAGHTVDIVAKEEVLIKGKSLNIDTGYQGIIKVNAPGGAFKIGESLQMFGSTLYGSTKQNGLNLDSPGDVTITSGKDKQVQIKSDFVVQNDGHATFKTNQINLETTSLNGDIRIGTKSGQVLISDTMSIQGPAIETNDLYKGFIIKSKSGIEMMAARTLTYKAPLIESDAQYLNLHAKKQVSLQAGFGGTVDVGSLGEEVNVAGMTFSGHQMGSPDTAKGLQIRSGNDLLFKAAGDIMTKAKRVDLEAREELSFKAPKVTLEATDWNEPLKVQLKGSKLLVDKMQIFRNSIVGDDDVEGLVLSSPKDINLRADTVKVNGGFQVNSPTQATSIRSSSIILDSSELGGTLKMDTNGGDILMNKVTSLDASTIMSYDAVTGLGLRSAADLRLRAKREAIIRGQTVDISAVAGLVMSASSMKMMSEGWGENIELNARGGTVQIDEIALDGSSVTANGAKALTMQSAGSFRVVAKDEVLLKSSSTLSLEAKGALSLSGSTISLTTPYGKPLEINSGEGRVRMAGLTLEDSVMKADSDLYLSSKSDIVLAAPKGAVHVQGNFRVDSPEGEVDLKAGKVSIEATEWGQAMSLSSKGGSVIAGGVNLDHSTLSNDGMKAFSLKSARAGLVFRTRSSEGSFSVSSNTVEVNAAKDASIDAKNIDITSGWNQGIQLSSGSGIVQMESLEIGAGGVGNSDRMKGLKLRSAEDIDILTKGSHEIKLSGGDINIKAHTSLNLKAQDLHFEATTGDVNIQARGATVIGGLRFKGDTLSAVESSHTARKTNLILAAAKDIAFHPGLGGKDKAVRIVGGLKVAGGEKIELAGKEVKIAATEGDVSIGTKGGRVNFDGVSMKGNTVMGNDLTKGLKLDSPNDLRFKTSGDLSMKGDSLSLSVDKKLSFKAEEFHLSSGWNSGVQINPKGGDVVMGGISMEGTTIKPTESLMGGLRLSGESVRIKATDPMHGSLVFDAPKIELNAQKEALIMSNSIKIKTAYKGSIVFDAPGGHVNMNGILLSSNTITTGDHGGKKGGDMLLTSARSIQLQTGEGHKVGINGNFAVRAPDTIEMSANEIKLESTKFNGDMKFNPKGSVVVGDVLLDGNTVSGASNTHDLVFRSETDLELSSERSQGSLSVFGSKVAMTSKDSMTMNAERLSMEVTGHNNDLSLLMKGGHVAVDGLTLGGADVDSTDIVKGLSLRSKHSLNIRAGIEHDVYMSGKNVKLHATKALHLEAENGIKLNPGLDKAVEITNGDLKIGHMQISGESIHSSKSMTLEAAGHLNFKPGDGHSMRIVSKSFVVDAEKEINLAAKKIEIEANDLNGNVNLIAPEGVLIQDNMHLDGTKIIMDDTVKGALIRSVGGIDIRTKNQSVTMQGGRISLDATNTVSLSAPTMNLHATEGDLKLSSGGNIITAGLIFDGTSIKKDSSISGALLLRGDNGVIISSKEDSRIDGKNVGVQAQESIVLKAKRIKLQSGQPLVLDQGLMVGGATNGISVMGTTITTKSKNGLSLEAQYGIGLHPGQGRAVTFTENLHVKGDVVSLSAKKIAISSTVLNENTQLNPQGGSISVSDSLLIDEASTTALDEYKGMKFRAKSGINMKATDEIRTESRDYHISAKEAIELNSPKISINAKDGLSIDSSGGVEISGMLFQGPKLEGSSDSGKKLELRGGAGGMRIQTPNTLSFVGKSVQFEADTAAVFKAPSITMMSDKMNEAIKIDGKLDVDDISIAGNLISTVDKKEGLILSSAQKIILDAPNVRIKTGLIIDSAMNAFSVQSAGVSIQSLAWGEAIKFDTVGGGLKFGQDMLLDGTTIHTTNLVKDMKFGSENDIVMKAKKHISMKARDVQVQGSDKITFESKAIHLTPGWNQDVLNELTGGDLKVGSLELSGSTLGTSSVFKPLMVNTQGQLHISSPKHIEIVSGAETAMRATGSMSIEGKNINLASKHNGVVNLNAKGGAVHIGDSLTVKGNTIHAQDHFSIASKKNIDLEPGENGAVIINSGLRVLGEETTINSGHVSVETTELNGDMRLITHGGSVSASGLLLGHSSVESADLVKPLSVASQVGIALQTKGYTHIQGETVSMKAAEKMQMIAPGIELSTGWDHQVQLDPHGSGVNVGGLTIDASSVTSTDATKDLHIKSAAGVRLASERVSLTGGNVDLTASNTLNIGGKQINLNTGLEGTINLNTKRGSTQIGSFTIQGGTIRNRDAQKDFVLSSAGSVILAPGKGKVVDVLAPLHVLTSGASSIKAGTLDFDSTGFGNDLHLSTKGGSTILNNGLEISGTGINPMDAVQHLALRAGRSLLLKAPESMDIVTKDFEVESTEAMKLIGKDIHFETGWNQHFNLMTAGGEVKVGGLLLSEAGVDSIDPTKGLQFHSDHGIQMRARRQSDILMAGEHINVNAKKSLTMSSGSGGINFETGSEQPLTIDAPELSLPQISITQNVIVGKSKHEGLKIESNGDVSLSSGENGQVKIPSDFSVLSPNKVNIAAPIVSLQATGLNHAVTLQPHGGEVRLGSGMNLDGAGVTTTDPFKGLAINGEGGILMKTQQEVRLVGKSFEADVEGTLSMVAGKISLETAWDKPIELNRQGIVRAGGIELDGGTVRSADTVKGLSLTSPRDMVITGKRNIHIAGNSLELTSEKSITMSGKSLEFNTGVHSPLKINGAGLAIGDLDISNSMIKSKSTRIPLEILGSKGVVMDAMSSRLRLDGEDVKMSATKSISLMANQIGVETEWNGTIALQPNGGDLSIDSIAASGSEISSTDITKGLSIRSGSGFHLQGKQVTLKSEKLAIDAKGSVSIGGNTVTLKSSYNEVISLEPQGGDVKTGDLRLSGNSIVTSSKRHLNFVSGMGVRFAGKEVRVAGNTLVMDSKRTKISGQTVELATGYNGTINMEPRGGNVEVDGLRLSGNTLDSADGFRGLGMRSNGPIVFKTSSEQGVNIMGKLNVQSGKGLYLKAQKHAIIASRSFAFKTHWNENVGVEPFGGSLLIDAIDVSGASVGSQNQKLDLRSKIGVDVNAKEQLMLEGGEVRVVGSKNVGIHGDAIRLSTTGIRRDITYAMKGGALAIDGIRIDGNKVTTAGQSKALELEADNGVVIEAPAEKEIRLQAGSIHVKASEEIKLDSPSDINIKVGFGKKIKLDAKGGSLDVDGLKMQGSSIATNDKLKGLLLTSPRNLNLVSSHHVRIDSKDITLNATNAMNLRATKIDLESTAFGSDIKLNPKGGHVAIDGLQLSGSRIQNNAEQGQDLQLNTAADMVLRPKGDMHIYAGKGVHMKSTKGMEIEGQSINLNAGSNGVNVKTKGGAFNVDGISIHGNTIESKDGSQGLRLQSAGDIDLSPGPNGKVVLQNAHLDMLMKPIYNVTTLSVDRITSTYHNKDIHIDPIGSGTVWIKKLKLQDNWIHSEYKEPLEITSVGGITLTHPEGKHLELRAHDNSSSIVDIKSDKSTSLFISAGVNKTSQKAYDATLRLISPIGRNPKIIMEEKGSGNSLSLVSNFTAGQFQLRNQDRALMSFDNSGKQAALYGDLLVHSATDNRVVTVKSDAKNASINILGKSGAHMSIHSELGPAVFNLTSGAGKDSVIRLTEQKGTSYNQWNIRNRASDNNFVIDNAADDLFTISHATGDVNMRGNLAVAHQPDGLSPAFTYDGDGTSSVMKLQGKQSSMLIESTNSDATLTLKVPAGQVPRVSLINTGGGPSFHMESRSLGVGSLAFTDGTNDLVTFSAKNMSVPGELVVRGTSTVQKDLTVGGATISGARALTVRSLDGEASMHIFSQGSHDASLLIESAAGGYPTLSLAERDADSAKNTSRAFNLVNDGKKDRFVINNGKGHEYITMDGTSGFTTLFGETLLRQTTTIAKDLIVGASPTESSIPGKRMVTVRSQDAAASLHLHSESGGDAFLNLEAADGHTPKIRLVERQSNGDRAFELFSDAGSDRFVISDGANEFISVSSFAPSVGFTKMHGEVLMKANAAVAGDLTVGGADVSGARAVTIRSGDNSAQLEVMSHGEGDSSVLVESANGGKPRIRLGQRDSLTSVKAFDLTNDGVTDRFVLSNGAGTELLAISAQSPSVGYTEILGTTLLKSNASVLGNFTVGGLGITGSRSMSIVSKDSSAKLHLKAAGSHEAKITIESAESGSSTLSLVERGQAGNKFFELKNEGESDRFVIKDEVAEYFTISAKPETRGFTTIRGDVRTLSGLHVLKDLTVGGAAATGTRHITVRSKDSSASVNVVAGPSSDATAKILAGENKNAVISLVEGSNTFDIRNEGISETFVISDTVNNLVTIKSGTGDTHIRGTLTTGVDPLKPRLAIYKETGNMHMQGDMTVGGDYIPGPRSATIKSNDNGARLDIQSNGTANAELKIKTPTDQQAIMTFKSGDDNIHVVNDGKLKQFIVSDGQHKLLAINRTNGNSHFRGDVRIGHETDNPMFTSLTANGNTTMRGNLMVGGEAFTGKRSVTVRSSDNEAEMRIISGRTSNALVELTASENKDAMLTINEGDNAFNVLNNGSQNKFIINDGVNQLIAVDRGSGNMAVRGQFQIGNNDTDPVFVAAMNNTVGDTMMKGDLTVGGGAVSGPRSATIISHDDAAKMHLQSGGDQGATLQLTVPKHTSAALLFHEKGGNDFSITNKGATNELIIADSEHSLIVISNGTGASSFRGDMTIGGNATGSPGPRSMTLKSNDGLASMNIISGGQSNVEMKLNAGMDKNSSIALREGSNAFNILNEGATDKFLINDGNHEMFSMKRGTGNTYMRGQLKVGHDHGNPMFVTEAINGDTLMQGDLMVGGQSASGPRSTTIMSNDNTAKMHVQAGGTSDATVQVTAPNGKSAILMLEEKDGNTFHILNDGANDALVFKDTNELLGIATGTGNTRIRGDLTVGGEIGAPGSRHMTVKATGGDASYNLIAAGSGNAQINMNAPENRSAIISMNEGTNAFNIANKGAQDRFTIDDGNSVLLGIYRGTGNTYVRGQLKVGHDPKQPMFVAESSNGNTLMQGDLTVGGSKVSGARSVTVKSFDSKATFTMVAGTSSDAYFAMDAPAGKNNIIDLKEGDRTIRMKHDGPLDSFIISDGNSTLLSTSRTNGNTFVKGVLAVGNITSDWVHMRCASLAGSTDERGKITGVTNWDKSIGMTQALCRVACDSSPDCTNAIWNDVTCAIRGGNPAMEVCGETSYGYQKGQAPALYTGKTGDTSMQGSLIVGGAGAPPGSRHINIETPSGDAALNVKAGAVGTAELNLEAPAGKDATINLVEGSDTFQITNKGSHDRLEISDGNNTLLAIARVSGATEVRGELKVGDSTDPVFRVEGEGINGRAKIKGDLTVGGDTVKGEKKITVQSFDSAASMQVISGGSSPAGAAIVAPAGADSWIALGEEGGSAFKFTNDGSHVDGLLHISDRTNMLFAVKPLSGDSFLRGSLDVGNKVEVRRSLKVGGTTGHHNVTVQSYDGASDMLIKSGGSGSATIKLESPIDQTAGISFIEDAGKQFHIMNRGATDALVISDGTHDLVKVYPETGDMYVKGELEVGSHTSVHGDVTVYGDIYEHCEGHRWKDGSKHCYKHFVLPKTFDEARKTCMKWKGHLASLTSAEENEFVKGSIEWNAVINTHGLWMGYTDAFGEQLKFQWISGEIAVTANGQTYENWETTPQDLMNQKDCVKFTQNGKWLESSCAEEKQFICEKDI